MPTYTKQLLAQFGPAYKNLAGIVSYTVKDVNGNILIPATSTGITEDPPGSGTYVAAQVWNTDWVGRIIWNAPNCPNPPTASFGPLWVSLNMEQPVPQTNPVQTVGDALNAARAEGFGKWVQDGLQLRLYGGDGTTIVRVFTLSDAQNPTSRT